MLADSYRMDKMEIPVPSTLLQEFEELCRLKRIRSDAMVRGWIEDYVAEQRPPKPLRSFTIAEIVWKLSSDQSIEAACEKQALALGYDDGRNLLDAVSAQLVEVAKEAGELYEDDLFIYGLAELSGKSVFFRIGSTDSQWMTEEPQWWRQWDS